VLRTKHKKERRDASKSRDGGRHQSSTTVKAAYHALSPGATPGARELLSPQPVPTK